MAEQVEDTALQLADLSGVVRAAYIIGHLQKLLDVLDEADKIHAGFPKELKEQLACETCGHDTNLSARAKGKLSLAFAQLGPDVRNTVREMMEQSCQYVGVWTGDSDDMDDLSLFGMLDENDMKVIEEMIGFVQKVGSKSVRHLLTFLESANEGEHSYLLIEAHNRQSEIRHRYNVTQESLDEFGLNGRGRHPTEKE